MTRRDGKEARDIRTTNKLGIFQEFDTPLGGTCSAAMR